MLNNGYSCFKPGRLYETACYYCKEVARNCNVTTNLAWLMATYRDIAKYGDRNRAKRTFDKQWEKELGPRFLLITCYLHDRAAKGKRDQDE